jgi:hypothetical protein
MVCLTPAPGRVPGKEPILKNAAYDTELFTSVAEENAYILRQLDLLQKLRHEGTTEAQWLSFKMGITTKQATAKIRRAQTTVKGPL